jgi:hypothetical protein
MTRARGLSLATILSMCCLSTAWTHAATFSCPSGDSACLINAIHAANAGPQEDTISLVAGTYHVTAGPFDADGLTAFPSVTSRLTIRGAGPAQTLIARDPGAPEFRLLHVGTSGALTFEGLSLQGGLIERSGAGIWNLGHLTLHDTHLSGHRSRVGGAGLMNFATAVISHSTFR